MTWVKICGTTNLEDALAAVEAGADALGFIFASSPRRIDPEQARDIIGQLPKAIDKVGVFVNVYDDAICSIATQAGLTAVQLQADDDVYLAERINKRIPSLKVFVACSMSHPKGGNLAMIWNPDLVHGFLLDSGTPTKRGGTGQTFDWEAHKPTVKMVSHLGRVIIAGGLTSTNVGDAIQVFHPWGVDVTSGVEREPGRKDHKKVRAFIAAARAADQKEATASCET